MAATSDRIISVFGLGLVGLVTAVCYARKGHQVLGIDPDRHRLERIRTAESPFFEPNLDEYLREAIAKRKLSVTGDPSANAQSDLAYITVGTPSSEDGSINLEYVKDAATAIGRSLRNSSRYQLVIVKSTVTPGTARNLVKPLIERESGKLAGQQFGLCSNVEFLREGSAIHDAEFPDRIIIGSEDPVAISKLDRFYAESHANQAVQMLHTTHENAELIKYATNTFLAMKVSFINTIANIAERTPGSDIRSVAAGMGLDDRIGQKFLNAGVGWGGSCFPKDLRALIAYSKKLEYTPSLLEAVVDSNLQQKQRAVQLARQILGSLKDKTIAILGLAFKPRTDDMREAVSITIIKELLAAGARVIAYDPIAKENARVIFGDNITYAPNPKECITSAECCVIVTEWDEFRTIPPKTFVDCMKRPIVIDGRGIYDAPEFTAAGVQLLTIGRFAPMRKIVPN